MNRIPELTWVPKKGFVNPKQKGTFLYYMKEINRISERTEVQGRTAREVIKVPLT